MDRGLLKPGWNASLEPERLGAVGQADEEGRNVRDLAMPCSTTSATCNINCIYISLMRQCEVESSPWYFQNLNAHFQHRRTSERRGVCVALVLREKEFRFIILYEVIASIADEYVC